MKKSVIKVDYKIDGESMNEALFSSVKKAIKFINDLKKDEQVTNINIDIVYANSKNLYYENGELNYEDNSELYL